MAIGGVVINFVADTAKATRDIGKVTTQLGKVDKTAKAAGGGMSKWAKAATAGVAAVGAVGIVAADAFVDMAKAAYSDKQAQDKLIRTIDRVKGVSTAAAEATGDWVDRMELLTLIADDDLRNALARLTPVTEDLGEAQKLAALAADASVASGKSYTAVVEAMAKAAGGNTAALKKLFPQLDAGPDKILTMKEAVDQLSGSYKGAAEAAADNDLFGRLSTAFGQIKEALGGVALPILEDLAAWFADEKNIKNLEKWIGKVEEWATAVGEDFKGKVEEFIAYLQSPEGKKAMEDFATNLKAIASAFDAISTALSGLIGWWDKVPDWLKGNPFTNLPFEGLLPGRTKDPYGEAPGEWFPKSNNPKPKQKDGARPVNITINNPKPEKASASIAAAQRAARYQESW